MPDLPVRGFPINLQRQQWLKIITIVQALLLWVETALVWLFVPEGWNTLWGIPLPLVRIGMAVAAIGWTVLVVLIWRVPQLPILRFAYQLIIRFRESRFWLLPVLVVLLPAIAYFASIWIGHTVLAILCLLFAALIYLISVQVWQEDQQSVLATAALLVTLTGIMMRLVVMTVEWVWADEGFYLSAAVNMLRGGSIAPLMMFLPPELPIFPLWGYAPALYGLWARVVGVGLMQARALSFLIGLLCLPAIYLTGKLWYGRLTAIITVSLAALSILFMESTIARPDAIGLAVVSWVLLLHGIAIHRDRPLLHVLVGAAAVLALETHFVVSTVVLAIGAYYLYDFVVRLREQSLAWWKAPIWLFIAGVLPMLGLFIYVHILSLPHPDRFFAILSGGSSASLAHWLEGRVAQAVYRYHVFWSFAPFESLLILCAAIAALIRRTRADIYWLVLQVVLNIGYFVIAPVGEIHYDIYALPILVAIEGALITHITERTAHPRLRTVPLYLVISLILMSWNYHLFSEHREDRQFLEREQIEPVVAYIDANLPEAAVIIGPASYYPYLVSHEVYINPFGGESLTGPRLAGKEPDDYWADVLLDTWPSAWINLNWAEDQVVYPEVFDSYMAARGGEQVLDNLMVVDDTEWVRVEPNDDPLQLVAYSRLPKAINSTQTFTIKLLLVKQSHDFEGSEGIIFFAHTPPADYVCNAFYDFPLRSDWSGELAHQWDLYEFHSVSFEVPRLCSGRFEIRFLYSRTENSFYSHLLGDLYVP